MEDSLKATRATLVHVYNTYLVDLIRLCKAANSEVASVIKQAGHKAIASASDTYILHAISSISQEDRRRSLAQDVAIADVWTSSAALSFQPLSGVPFERLLPSSSTDKVTPYLFILAALAITYEENSDDLAQTVVNVLARAQQGSCASDNLLQMIDGILEDDIVSLLEKVAESYAAPPPPPSEGGGLDDILSQFKNSKIAQVAAEISEDIDVDSFDPSQLDMSKLGDPNSALGSIVSKVGSKIQSKLSSGEVNHADLIAEACGFLKAFQPMMAASSASTGSPNVSADAMQMLSDLMGSMGAAAGSGGGSSKNQHGKDALQARRERLQSKLQAAHKKLI
jgi:hypothetical protein